MHWPKSQDADLLILIWEEVRRIHQQPGILLEVEHVRAHRSEKEKHTVVRGHKHTLLHEVRKEQ